MAHTTPSATSSSWDTNRPSRACLTTESTRPVDETLRSPSVGATFASLASESTQACTLAALTFGVPSSPSVDAIFTQDAFRTLDAVWSLAPSETVTVRATIALASSATAWASAVVTGGSVSTNCTVAVVDVAARVRRFSATASRRLVMTTVWPITAGVTTNDFLFFARRTLASMPTLPACSTSSSATSSRLVVSVVRTMSTSRGDTRDVAYDDQDSLAANTASTVASTSRV